MPCMSELEERMMEWTREQGAVIDWVFGPLLVVAVAGAGKTSVLLARIKALLAAGVCRASDILMTTFGKHGATDMAARAERMEVPQGVEYRTLHSVALQMVRSAGHRSRLDVPKGWQLTRVVRDTLRDLARECGGKDGLPKPGEVLNAIGLAKAALIWPEGWTAKDGTEYPPYFTLLKGDDDDIASIPGGWAVDVKCADPEHAQIVARCYRAVESACSKPSSAGFDRCDGVRWITFDDMLAVTARAILRGERKDGWVDSWQGHFRFVQVDEVQDNNLAQWTIVEHLARDGNLCAVGDDSQCVEASTLVWTQRGERHVGELLKGDSVLAYRNGSCVQQTVRHVSRSSWTWGFRITTADGRSLVMSPNHKIWAALPELTSEQMVVYLMFRKDMGYRVGITNKCRSDGTSRSAFGCRASQERAERLWILDVCQDREEALFRERCYSLSYGIPTDVFMGSNRGLNQKRIDAIFADFGANGARLLEAKHRSFDLPHWISYSYTKHGRMRRTVQMTAHGAKSTSVALEWQGDDLDAALAGTGFVSQPNGRRRLRRWFANYRDALAFAQDVAVSADAHLSRRLSTPEGPLRLLTASGLFAGMSVVVTDDQEHICLDEIVAVERMDGTFFDLDVDDASNFFGGGILSHNSIYQFRGAVPALMRRHLDQNGATLAPLGTNWRSGQAILDHANRILDAAPDRLFQGRMVSGIKRETHKAAAEYDDAADEARAIVDEIAAAIGAGEDPDQITCLYRLNACSGPLEVELIGRAIPYRVQGSSFFSQGAIKAAIGYLACALDETDESGLRACYAVPLRGLGRGFVKQFKSVAGARVGGLGRWRRGAEDLTWAVDSVCNELEEHGPAVAVKFIMEDLGVRAFYRDEGADAEDETEVDLAAEALAACANSLGSAEALVEYARSMTGREDRGGQRDAKRRVTLSTIHRAKGLEWDRVFVVGMSEGLLPFRRGDQAEELRLAYVAVTRACSKLTVTWTADAGPSEMAELGGFVALAEGDDLSLATDAA